MSRSIKHIIVHAVNKSDKAAKPSSDFHYVISALGCGYHKHKAQQAVRNLPAVDAQAYHIKYILDDTQPGGKQPFGSSYQQHTLYERLLSLIVQLPDAVVVNAGDMGVQEGIEKSFDIKAWMKQYLPDELTQDREPAEDYTGSIFDQYVREPEEEDTPLVFDQYEPEFTKMGKVIHHTYPSFLAA